MIDIHNHILPGFDDGPDAIDTSLKMAKIAADDGIKIIVATPHSNNGVYKTSFDKILEGVERLNQALEKEGIPLSVLPGSDVYIDLNLTSDVNDYKIMTVNNKKRYILLELPHCGVPRHLSDLVWQLSLSGITVIFSHPERNEAVQEDINILYDFIMQGALSQITAMSLTGEFGKKARKCAVSLLRHNLAHVIATDAHSVNRRPPVLSRGMEAAKKITGHDRAFQMVFDIPGKIIRGENFTVPEPVKKKSRFFA